MSSTTDASETGLSLSARAFLRGSAAVTRGLDWLTRAVEFLERAAVGRRALRDLAGADDHMLKDMGLDRSDLRNAAAEPFYRDPTSLLAGRVEEGRRHRSKPAVRSAPYY